MIHGDQPITIYWLFDNDQINKDLGILVNSLSSRSSVLTIDSIKAKHAGNYTCVGKNVAGITTHSTSLIVNGLNKVKILNFNQRFSFSAKKILI